MTRFRFATCNEIFQRKPFEDACTGIRAAGYSGIELAPFTLAGDPAQLTAEDRATVRKTIAAAGLEFVGLHWLLAAPKGLHATTRDADLRRRTWQYVHSFVDLCADLSNRSDGGAVIVFGSPQQRSSRDGLTGAEATQVFVEGLSEVAPHAAERGVTLLVEALSPDQTDVVTSLAEAVEIVRQIGSPAIQTMFDTHNAVKETRPHADLIRGFFPYIKHIHVNEMDGKEPGTGDYDFGAIMSCLEELGYNGWVSLEAFDFERDPKEVIANSIAHLRSL